MEYSPKLPLRVICYISIGIWIFLLVILVVAFLRLGDEYLNQHKGFVALMTFVTAPVAILTTWFISKNWITLLGGLKSRFQVVRITKCRSIGFDFRGKKILDHLLAMMINADSPSERIEALSALMRVDEFDSKGELFIDQLLNMMVHADTSNERSEALEVLVSLDEIAPDDVRIPDELNDVQHLLVVSDRYGKKRALPWLLKIARTESRYAKEAILALNSVLKRTSTQLSSKALRVFAKMKYVKGEYYKSIMVSNPAFDDGPYEALETVSFNVDCSDVRDLARKELKRRQIMQY